MGAIFLSIEVERVGASAKFAASYDLPWWVFHRVLKDFLGEVEVPVAAYIEEFASLRGQQAYLDGKRPYSRRQFDYLFPDLGGLTPTAAALTKHWLHLALGVWASELPKYFERNGLELLTPLPDLKDTLLAERFIVLRGATWEIEGREEGGFILHRHASFGPDTLSFADLDPAEQLHVQTVYESGQCHCGLCMQLAPDPVGEQAINAMLAKDLNYFAINHAGLWISSLINPSTHLIRRLIDAIPQLTANAAAATMGQFRITKAFSQLSQRIPAALTIFQEGLASENDWTRATIIGALHNDQSEPQAFYARYGDLLMSTLPRSVPEAWAVLGLLQELPPPAELHGALSLAMRQALLQFGHLETPYPAPQIKHQIKGLWQYWFAEGGVPAEIAAEYDQLVAR